MQSIRELLEKVFYCEREGDASPRAVANWVYNSILNNFNDYRVKDMKNTLTLSPLVGENLLLIFSCLASGCAFSNKIIYNQKQVEIKNIKIGCKDIIEYYNAKKFKDCLTIKKTQFIHEMIHYLDSRKFPLKTPDGIEEYTNDEAEFNAHYQGMAHSYDDKVNKICNIVTFSKDRKIGLFKKHVGRDAEDFRTRFLLNIANQYPHIINYTNQTYVTKWNKRIYQLYNELKERVEKSKNTTLKEPPNDNQA